MACDAFYGFPICSQQEPVEKRLSTPTHMSSLSAQSVFHAALHLIELPAISNAAPQDFRKVLDKKALGGIQMKYCSSAPF